MKSTLLIEEEMTTPTAIETRPRWDEEHDGLTWRDMPQQSHSDVTGKKLLFALYRAGATTAEEDQFIAERRRQKLSLN